VKFIVLRRYWTLRQQLTILTVLFLSLGGIAVWLVAELFQSRTVSVISRNQEELASADAALIKLFWESDIGQTVTPGKQWDKQLQELSTEALATFPRVEGGFYIFQKDQLLGYGYPTHGGPIPKKDIPPTEAKTILQLARRATSQGLPQQLVLYPGLDLLVLRAEPLPLWGAVWTMKRLPTTSSEDTHQSVLSVLVVLMNLLVGGWTFYIALQLHQGVQRLQQSIKAIEEGKAEQIPPLNAEMGLLGEAINTMHHRRQELEQRLHRVEYLTSLGQLVAGVAHEVRNPLASMRLNLQYTQRQLQKHNITMPIPSLLEQVDRLEHLVHRLLYFDQNQQEDLAITSLEAIVEESVSLLRLKAEEQGITLVYRTPAEPLPQVPLSRRALGQVMVNLILNAIQASPEEGQVEVGVDQQDYLIAWVEDQGQGLPPEDKERVFEPFYSTKPEGTGLGLAISYEIVARHGGHIDLESRPGCTRFSVYLPYKTLTVAKV